MKLKLPNISFDSEGPYSSGQILQGKATWRLENNVKVQFIQLQIFGKCKVKWTKGSGDDEKTYKAKEIYIDHRIMLFGSDTEPEVSLTAGHYSMPFSYCLPANLPPTYFAKYGTIAYEVILSVKKPGIFGSLKSHSVPFIVTNCNDDILQRPLRLTAETDKYGCCCTTKADFKFEVNIGQSAFLPGDRVFVNGFAFNGSDEDVDRTTLKLVLQESFHGVRTSRLKTKVKAHTIAEWYGEKVAPHSQISFANRETLTIPRVHESDLRHCKFIDVKCYIEFVMTLPGLCSDDLTSRQEDVDIVSRPSAIPSVMPSASQQVANDQTVPSVPLPMFPHPMPPPGTASGDAPPSYDDATKMDGKYSIPPVDERMSSLGGGGAQSHTGYYDWSQSAFTYN